VKSQGVEHVSLCPFQHYNCLFKKHNPESKLQHALFKKKEKANIANEGWIPASVL
jgi:hypothetical protein